MSGRSSAERRMIRAMERRGRKAFRVLRSAEMPVKNFRRREASSNSPAEAWDEGWRAARVVVELHGAKVWAHTVTPDGYEDNPYRAERIRTIETEGTK